MTTAEAPQRSATEIGADIKARRLAAGKQAKAFAAEIGISAKHLNNIESGRMRASVPVYRLIAGLLGVSADDLLGVKQ